MLINAHRAGSNLSLSPGGLSTNIAQTVFLSGVNHRQTVQQNVLTSGGKGHVLPLCRLHISVCSRVGCSDRFIWRYYFFTDLRLFQFPGLLPR